MKEINKEEMKKVEGGSNTIIIASVITGIITFITGVLHGYVNPKECN